VLSVASATTAVRPKSPIVSPVGPASTLVPPIVPSVSLAWGALVGAVAAATMGLWLPHHAVRPFIAVVSWLIVWFALKRVHESRKLVARAPSTAV